MAGVVFCAQCGVRNDGDARFCLACGAPLVRVSAQAGAESGSPTVSESSPVTQPVQTVSVMSSVSAVPPTGMVTPPASSPAVSSAGAVTAVVRRGWSRRLMVLIAVIVVVVLVVAGGVVGWWTYRAELWGGKTLPDPASLVSQADTVNGKQAGKDKKSGQAVVSAKAVTQALKAKGLKTRTVREFSGRQSGSFLGYKSASAGTRVKTGSTVTVRESAGPGVPKDTVGKPATKVVDTLKDMGVPVHYKQVVVSEDSKIPEGQVAVTSPAPGMPVSESDKNTGINVGVATHGEGIPVDIMGQDPDGAKAALEAAGYNVTVTPHFSSKQYVGKISGSYPAPGTTLNKGSNITLYEGIDKTREQEVTIDATSDGDYAELQPTAFIGMYCKATVNDSDKDCITLEQTGPDYNQKLQIKGHETDDIENALDLAYYGQSGCNVLIKPISDCRYNADQLPLKNHLLLKNWGMFELYAGDGLPTCDDTIWDDMGIYAYCDAGTVKLRDSNDWEHVPDNTGLTYRMKDFLVYVPVGSDLIAWENSGYFDAAALAEAKKQKPVDTSRPFILMRDPSLYDQTEVSADDPNSQDPFTPGNFNGKSNPLVPMKPAVSDATVYYLMEQNVGLDWSSLPDAKVTGAETTTSSSNDNAAFHEVMKQAAGDYMFSSGSGGWSTDLHVNADGTFSGQYHDANLGDVSAEHPRGAVIESDFTGRFSSAEQNKDDSYTLQCAVELLSVKGNIGDKRIENGREITVVSPYGMTPCNKFVFYPKGFDSAKMTENERSWATSTLSDYSNGGPLQQKALSNMSLDEDGKPSELTFFERTD